MDRPRVVMLRAVSLTALAMAAFAANSVICRMALRDGAIDPAGFTTIRLVTGAATLALILMVRKRAASLREGSLSAGLMLFGYAAFFSFAYVSLSAATGALILFGCVQGTMIAMGLRGGDRPRVVEWQGWLAALGGLVVLLLPGLEAPPIAGAASMAAAGIAWGAYSSRGRNESDAVGATAGNFVRAVPPALVLLIFTIERRHLTTDGVLLASLSGAVTSGLGYVLWYAALPALTSMQAALVQLTVPALAAVGGVLVLGEALTSRMVVAGGLILGGLALALAGRARASSAGRGGTIRR